MKADLRKFCTLFNNQILTTTPDIFYQSEIQASMLCNCSPALFQVSAVLSQVITFCLAFPELKLDECIVKQVVVSVDGLQPVQCTYLINLVGQLVKLYIILDWFVLLYSQLLALVDNDPSFCTLIMIKITWCNCCSVVNALNFEMYRNRKQLWKREITEKHRGLPHRDWGR